ncbi:MAG: hypothetical protein GF375_03550 [Candidatus Omnitrophica bacterium]|nr:hypothetical protein [Candidatus Omnitrophota bacterium]MBD3269136.1 hypothetical protein [Candidatus Omnitrophota bacterium]
MRINYFLIFFLIFFLTGIKDLLAANDAKPDNYIEIDFIRNTVELVDFLQGKYKLQGKFSFDLDRSGETLSGVLKGEEVYFGGKKLGRVRLDFTREGRIIFINNLSLPQFIIEGRLNLNKREVFITAKGQWREEGEFLKGDLSTETKVWGNFSNLLASGNIIIKEGSYNQDDFAELRLYFLGKPPVLNLIDSSVTLQDGSVFKIQGDLDLRNFANMIPDAEFVSQRIFIGGWQLVSENNTEVGLLKNVDEDLDVYFHTRQPEYSSEP